MESRTGRSTFRELRAGTHRNLVGEDNKSAVGTGCVRVPLTRIVLFNGAANSRVPTIPITPASAKQGNLYSPIRKHFGTGNVSSSNSSLD
jgi:hypothetical protein